MAMKSTTERTVKTKFDGDASDGIRATRAMERELKRLEREHAKAQAAFAASTTRAADKVVSSLASVTKGILAVGSVAGSAQGLAGATAAVATLSGTALALPGILAGGAAAGGVFALAMSGIGDAIAAEDLEEFNKVTKDMAPNAVKLAQAVRDQGGRFKELKKTVQGNFFEGFDQDVRQLADKYFPILNKQSGAIAGEWNKMGREASKALLDPKSVARVNSVLGDTTDGLKELRPSLGNVLSGFLGLSSVGSTKLPALGRAVNNLTQDFEDWVEAGIKSGRINEIIDDGIASAKKFGTVFGNLGASGAEVWRILGEGEDSFLDGLVDTTQALEDFLKSAEGQEVIETLASALQTTADVARDVFTTAMRELGPIVTEIGPAFNEIARSVGDFLVDALEIAGPMLQSTARFLSENKEVLGDLVPLLLGAAVAYKGLSVAKDATTWIAGLSGAFDTNTKKAKDLDGALGKGGKSGGTGLVGSLAGIAAIVGGGVAIDIINDSEIAKANDFKISLDGILSALGKVAEFGAFGLMMKYNDAVVSGVGKIIEGAQQGEIILTISSDTSQAERNLEDLKDQVRRSEEYVTINGNRRTADQALADVIAAIDAGEGTVEVNGNTINSQRALEDLIAQVNRSSGTVIVDGNPVPAGQVLFGLLTRVNGSRATMSVDADASAAQGVVNRFITMNNGRQIDIFVNAHGDAGGIASAGRLASGGRPFFNGRVSGPGTRTSDTAGLFALSDDEHVWSAADVAGAGGHGAMYRLRALARQGLLRGFSDGGTPAYLTTSIPAPRQAPRVSVAAPNTTVAVYVDGQEFRGIVKTAIDNDRREQNRRARSGRGAL
jgi:hypothetical protein